MRKDYPLSKEELSLYLACTLNPDRKQAYLLGWSVELPKDTEKARIEKAVEKLFARHRILSARIERDANGNLVKYDCEEKPVIEYETSAVDSPASENYYWDVNLDGGRMYRVLVVESPSSITLFIFFHHLIIDGTGRQVMVRDFEAAFRGEDLGEPDFLPYEFAEKELEQENTKAFEDDKEYYHNLLSGIEVQSPEKDLSEETERFVQKFYDFTRISEADVKNKKDTAKVRTSTIFLGAVGHALAVFAGSEQSVVASAMSGRTDETKDSSGMFVRTLPMVCNPNPNHSVDEYLRELDNETTQNRKHSLYTYMDISQDLQILLPITFAYQGDMISDKVLFDGKERKMEFIRANESDYEMRLYLWRKNGKYTFEVLYRADHYSEGYIDSLAQTVEQILSEMLKKQKMGDIDLVAPAQKELLDGFNRTERDYEKLDIVTQFKNQVKNYPENFAVIFKDKKLTYREVDETTDKIASYISGKGIGREDVVSILIPRSEFMVLASIGTLKAGAAYEPLDPSYPSERLEFMIADAGAKLLIADRSLMNLVPNYKGDVLYLDEIASLPAAKKLDSHPALNDRFIMLYTSGTTGTPKGVMLEHGNLAAFCAWYRKCYSLTEKSRVAAYASFGFDANMMDLYPALTTGSAVIIIPEEDRLDLIAIKKRFDDEGVTHSFMTTQVGRQFAEFYESGSLKYLSVGGEKLVPINIERPFKFYNGYGPTECTIFASVFEVDRLYTRVPIGKPLDNVKFYVCDKNMRRLPVCAPGELLISGHQVGRSYLNRPEKNAEVFIKNPFESASGYEKAYRTGDIVRLLSDGNVDCIGRNDGQVKIRGFRVELPEIESVIREFKGIKDVTVQAFDAPTGGKFVAAYIVSDETISIDALNEFIKSKKPPYMVPACTMQIEKIPLNQNQKVNKRALPTPELKATASAEIVPVENENQQKIFDCIKQVVGHSEFGITSDIFEAGLTSIGAIRLNVLLSKAFDVSVKTSDLKTNPTIKQLEGFLLGAHKAELHEKQADYPLTSSQDGIFVECMANPESTIYNIPLLLKLNEKISVDKLKAAMEKAVAAHPYIKTRLFMNDDGDIRQKRNDDEPFTVKVYETLDKSNLVKPFNLLGESLFRMALYRTGEGNYVFIEMHHIVADGTSLAILFLDISRAYNGEELEKESCDFYEASLIEHELKESDSFAKAKAFYENCFAGCGGNTDFAPNVHGDEPELGELEHAAEHISHENVERLCKKYGVTENVFFVGAFGLFLAQHNHLDGSVFTTIYNGRSDSRFMNTLGMFVKTLPVRSPSFTNAKDYFVQVQNELLGLMENDLYPFEEASREFNIVPNTMIAYQGDSFNFDELCGEKVENIPLKLNAAKMPFSLDVYKSAGGYQFFLEYRKDSYSKKLGSDIMASFEKFVSALCDEEPLSELAKIAESASAKRPAINLNDSAVDLPFESVVSRFEKQVAKNSGKTAVIADGKSLTYAQLNEQANRVAHSLLNKGMGREKIVAVMLERSVGVYVTRQGILKSGSAFMCIAPDYPNDRVEFILTDSGAKFIITNKEQKESRAELWEKTGCTPLLLEDLISDMSVSAENPNVEIKENDLCYCIYTSGSTGKPKGVMIEHMNLANFVDANPKNYETLGYTEKASVSLSLAAMTFDVSIMEEFIPLTNGMTAVIATDEEIHNLDLLAELVIKNKVDMLTTTPSFASVMVEVPQMRKALAQIKSYDFGAEAFIPSLYDKITEINPDAHIMNGYGPTETTISCTMQVVTGSEDITIGRPNANVFVHIIDENNREVPQGTQGELLISGKGVGRGYVNLPEKTADVFITFNGMRAYKSGDLALINEYGEIEFHGRKDNQVKLRGLRVELGEIESVIASFPDVTNVIVLAIEAQYLVAYFTAKHEINTEELKAFASERLTEYMVPNIFMQLDEMPLTPNQKIDKKRLPEPDLSSLKTPYVAPRNETEETLCAIFAKVLKQEKIGIDDDFFMLGGTSLLASKVAIMCMNQQIPLVYADVFKMHTVRLLGEKLTQSTNGGDEAQETKPTAAAQEFAVEEPLAEVLSHNTVEHVRGMTSKPLGTVLLSGATGFLGIHILHELIEHTDSVVYCVIRKGNASSLESRLKTLLKYYFEVIYNDLFGTRIRMIEGDITNMEQVESLKELDFDTVINCAASVKHFVSDDSLDRINVDAVKNLVSLCLAKKARLIHISTTSTGAYLDATRYRPGMVYAENMLHIGQDLSNAYVRTKFLAEEAVLTAVKEQALDAKIMRVGNLMSRYSDGEFQINSVTNSFMLRLRAYAALGAFPCYEMDMPAEFSPIDMTAASIIALAGTPKDFTVFHARNAHDVQMGDVLAAMNECGIEIKPVSDEEFQKRISAFMEDESRSLLVAPLISYNKAAGTVKMVSIPDVSTFTTKALYQLGFKWPIITDDYISKAIMALQTLGFFDEDA